MPKGVYDRHARQGAEPCSPLAAARIAAGLTQAQLAKRVGVTMAVVSNWERGLSQVGAKHLPALADAIGFAPEASEARPEKEYPFPDFGEALTSLRERAGLKRGEVAHRLGVTLPCYAGYEQGKTLPPPKRLNDIAAVLGVPCSDLAALDGYQIRAKAAPGSKARFPRFGGYIRACREREGFTLRGAAERLGIHYVTLNQYELGAALPRQKTTRAIADLLHEPADRLLAMREDAEGSDSVRIMEAGRRVADLRRKAGLTQRQLAEACGLNISTVACMERGKSNPANAPDTVKKLAAALCVPESYIVGGCKKDRGTGVAHHRADLTGKRFSMLLVTGMAYVKDCTVYWNCRCDCGNSTIVPTERLTVGKTKSCGCLKASGVRARETLLQTIRPYLVDGTNIRAHERTQPNRDNATTGIRGVCYRASHKTYFAYMGFKGTTYRKAFKNLDDAVEYRKSLENTLSKPAVEAFYAERNEHHDEQS